MTNIIAAAQQLGRLGFRVHPLKAKDQPYTKYSQTATSDLDKIANLFGSFKDPMIGIATGQGLVVIDDDRREGLDEELTRAAGRIATTPKWGVHYYFACTTPLRNSVGKLAAGVDVRGEGGYVVAPPTDGRVWLAEAALTPLPGLLVAACLRADTAARAAFEPRSQVPAGERHDYLVRFAGWALSAEMADDLDGLFAVTLSHAMQVCDPWPTAEIGRVKRHIFDVCCWVWNREQAAA
jgi:hypothetical protein